MGRLLVILLGIVIVLIVAAVTIPFFLPTDFYKSQLTSAVKSATGRDLTVNGDLSISLLPPLSVTVEDVSFSNAPGASTPDMATMKSLTIGVKVIPYLTAGKVEVSRFVLDEPKINLEIDEQGKGNWEFEGLEASAQPAADTQPADTSGGPAFSDISLGDVRLSNGEVTMNNRQTGERLEAREISMSIGLPSLDGPLTLDGGMLYNSERLNLDARVAKPRAFMDAQSTELSMELASKLVNMEFDGQAAMLDAGPNATLPIRSTGKLDLDVPSVRKLSAWAGSPMEPGNGFENLSIEGDVATDLDRASFDNAELEFDRIRGKGAFQLALGGARPKLTGTLDLNALDLRPYQENGAASSGGSVQQTSAQSAQASGWSNEPIDLSGLQAADADITMTAAGLETTTVSMGKSRAELKLDNGKLDLNVEEASLYEGNGKLYVGVDARQPQAVIRNNFSLNVIQMQPLVQDLFKTALLKGLGDFVIDVNTRGRSQRDFVSALNGDGRIELGDGALFGIDIVELFKSPQETLTSMALNMADPGRSRTSTATQFAELAGTYAIRNGVWETSDLVLSNPLMDIAASGTVDLVNQRVNLVLKPTNLKQGGGGLTDTLIRAGILLRGPWSGVTPVPNIEGVARDAARGAIQEGIRRIIPGQDGDEANTDGEEQSPEESARGLVRGLFGGDDDDDKKDETPEEREARKQKKAEKKAAKDAEKAEKKKKKKDGDDGDDGDGDGGN